VSHVLRHCEEHDQDSENNPDVEAYREEPLAGLRVLPDRSPQSASPDNSDMRGPPGKPLLSGSGRGLRMSKSESSAIDGPMGARRNHYPSRSKRQCRPLGASFYAPFQTSEPAKRALCPHCPQARGCLLTVWRVPPITGSRPGTAIASSRARRPNDQVWAHITLTRSAVFACLVIIVEVYVVSRGLVGLSA